MFWMAASIPLAFMGDGTAGPMSRAVMASTAPVVLTALLVWYAVIRRRIGNLRGLNPRFSREQSEKGTCELVLHCRNTAFAEVLKATSH
jgi:hypothetical protein